MGTRAEVMVLAEDDDVEVLLWSARERIEALEGKWSRFLPESEVSRLNRLAGSPVIVSEATRSLIECALAGWEATDGAFDPFLLEPLRALGYDRDLAALVDSEVAVDPMLDAITLPRGGGFDPGGIGKGYAADLVASELAVGGARAVLVNLGGDQRAGGIPPGGGWRVRVENPLEPDGAPLGSLRLAQGGIATTSPCRRRRRQGGIERHHVLDPRTLLPAETDLEAVTVVAREAWWAEVLAKAAFVAGRAAGMDLLERHGVSGLLVGPDATLAEVGTLAAA